MFAFRRSFRLLYVVLAFLLLEGLVTPPRPVQAATTTVYDAIPATLPPNMASVGYQATSTYEFGDYLHLAGSYRALSTVTVTMSTWALHSTYPSMPASGWTHPITLKIYNVIPGTPNVAGSLIVAKTQTFDIPWRPEADPACGTAWRASNGSCYNGYAFNITFDLTGMGVTLPNDIIVSIAYNTETRGYAPIGASGPYNSLNIGVAGTLSAGTDDSADKVFLYSTSAGMYGDGGSTAVFREVVGWSPYGTLPVRVVTTDGVYPVLSASVPADNAALSTGPAQLNFTFSEDVRHDESDAAADYVGNYRLFEMGADGDFDTLDCAGGVSPNDTNIAIDSAVYSPATFTATLSVNGGVPLPNGAYRLLACGTTSIEDADGEKLNDGLSDSVIEFRVAASAAAVAAVALPQTGFAPDRVTALPEQTITYADSDLWLEIPRLGVQMDIVGVPQSADGTWDVAWLGQDAGWLEGSAFPTWNGNSVLTGHVWDADNTAGPFRYINTLWYGDQIVVHAWGADYVYEVRSVQQVGPGSTAAMMKHEELPWVTLVTCRGYDEASNTYKYRVLVRAVLVEVR